MRSQLLRALGDVKAARAHHKKPPCTFERPENACRHIFGIRKFSPSFLRTATSSALPRLATEVQGAREPLNTDRRLHLKNIEDFNALAREGKANLDDAQVFLKQSQDAIKGPPLAARREAAAKVGASHILLWLWDQPLQNQQCPRELGGILCWFIQAEGLEDYIWKWLEVAARSNKALHSAQARRGNEKALYRRLDLLASLIQAHIDWTEDGTAIILHFDNWRRPFIVLNSATLLVRSVF